MKRRAKLNNAPINQLDFLHNRIFQLLLEVNPGKKRVSWDMEIIGEIADVIETYFIVNKICTTQEINPYIEG
jgi:hypothetical protein